MTLSIAEAYKAMTVNFSAGLPVMLLGPSGIGKSELGIRYATDQGDDYGIFELNLALANLPDVMGVLMPGREKWPDTEGNIIDLQTGRYAYPYFLRDKRTGVPAICFKRGIIIFEEYGQAVGDVKRAVAPVMWEKRIGEWQVPNFDILINSNRPEDRSGVGKDFDFVINRRVQLEVRADRDGWLVWAHDHGITNASMAYAHRNEAEVFANKAPEKQGPWMTPRSLVSGDKFVVAAVKHGYKLDDMFVWENLAGIFGEGNATKYIAFAKVRDHLPTISAIIADPLKCRLPDEMDQQIFLVFDMASKANKDNIAPMIQYINRMPSDFSIAFYRSAMQRDSALRSTKAFGDWAVKNVGLLSAISTK